MDVQKLNVTIDVKKLNDAYRAALPDRFETAKQKSAEATAVGLVGIAGSLEDASNTFCKAWPIVLPWIRFGLKPLRWWNPAIAAMAEAAIDAIDKSLVPQICKAG